MKDEDTPSMAEPAELATRNSETPKPEGQQSAVEVDIECAAVEKGSRSVLAPCRLWCWKSGSAVTGFG